MKIRKQVENGNLQHREELLVGCVYQLQDALLDLTVYAFVPPNS